MPSLTTAALSALIFAVAMLYAAAGQAGASGYLAAMALFSLAPEVMKPTALVLNMLVAAVAALRFYRAGCFAWPVFWPFVLTSIPFSFLGGVLTLPGPVYRPLVGILLLGAACRFFCSKPDDADAALRPLPLWIALISGAGIGLLSGLIGVGGGIFLSPLLLAMNWANARQTAGVSAAFIFVNSLAALLGHVSSVAALPAALPIWALAAVAGGYLGAAFGSQHLSSTALRRVLAVILLIAALRMLFA